MMNDKYILKTVLIKIKVYYIFLLKKTLIYFDLLRNKIVNKKKKGG